jgi:hypothetical protein
MATCIYCLESKAADCFRKREHVLPESFGAFRDNLTLRDTVCDDCNKAFGDSVELHLARDTPDGLNRFLIGGKDPGEFKSLGRSSSLVSRATSGPLMGARVVHQAKEGVLGVKPLPQVALAKSDSGPWEKWFLLDQLPSSVEMQALVGEGYCHVHLCEVDDPEAALTALRERGFQCGPLWESRPAGWMSRERVETAGQLGVPFGRAITKVAFNYLAHEYGAGTALMAAFNTARRFARYGGGPDEVRIWDLLPPEPGPLPLGHLLSISWDPWERTADAVVSFHGSARYRIRLGANLLVVPTESRSHFFDLATMVARRVR